MANLLGRFFGTRDINAKAFAWLVSISGVTDENE